MGDLGAIRSQRFTGSERFHDGKRAIGFSLLDYWQWSASDLVSNTSRGVVAEFLVASAIGIAGGVREEWAASGSTTVYDRALLEARRILETHIPDPLPEAVAQQLNSIVTDAERELGLR